MKITSNSFTKDTTDYFEFYIDDEIFDAFSISSKIKNLDKFHKLLQFRIEEIIRKSIEKGSQW